MYTGEEKLRNSQKDHDEQCEVGVGVPSNHISKLLTKSYHTLHPLDKHWQRCGTKDLIH